MKFIKCIFLVPSVFGRLYSFFVRLQILFFWYCLPNTIVLAGIPHLLFRELEEFADLAKMLVLVSFLSDNLAGEPRSQVGAYETF